MSTFYRPLFECILSNLSSWTVKLSMEYGVLRNIPLRFGFCLINSPILTYSLQSFSGRRTVALLSLYYHYSHRTLLPNLRRANAIHSYLYTTGTVWNSYPLYYSYTIPVFYNLSTFKYRVTVYLVPWLNALWFELPNSSGFYVGLWPFPQEDRYSTRGSKYWNFKSLPYRNRTPTSWIVNERVTPCAKTVQKERRG